MPKFSASDRNTIIVTMTERSMPQTIVVKGDINVRYLSTGSVWWDSAGKFQYDNEECAWAKKSKSAPPSPRQQIIILP